MPLWDIVRDGVPDPRKNAQMIFEAPRQFKGGRLAFQQIGLEERDTHRQGNEL